MIFSLNSQPEDYATLLVSWALAGYVVAAPLYPHTSLGSYRAARTVFEAVPWSRAMLTVTRGGHLVSTAGFPAVSASCIAFLRWSMYGGTPALDKPAALGAVATLDGPLSPLSPLSPQ